MKTKQKTNLSTIKNKRKLEENMISKAYKSLDNKGITLIALVVTIVVLLILAAVSLNLVLGNNGLITKSKDAKDQTEIAQIKDEAELVKAGLLVDDLTGERALNHPRLITAIQEHFEGSSLENGRIVTKDGKYDIIVKNNLDIVVVKHGEEYISEGEIGITYTTQDVDEGVEVTLYFEMPGIEPLKEYTEWATEVLNNLPTTEPERTEALEQMFIKSNKYYIGANLPEEAKDITDFAEWMSFCETQGSFEEGDEIPTTIEAFRIYANGKYGWTYSTVEEMLIDMDFVEPEQYEEYINGGITVEVSNGDSLAVRFMQATYTITQNGTYTFTATGPNGETGEITIEISSISYKIGDYVNYTYDTVASGYSLLSTQSGYSRNQTVAQSATTLKWRILNIDEENGTIDLVSAAPTDNMVLLIRCIRIQ